jgi:hypothetical protein
MTNEERIAYVQKTAARLRLLSHIAKMGLNHWDYMHLQSSMNCTREEIDKILEEAQEEWTWILEN